MLVTLLQYRIPWCPERGGEIGRGSAPKGIVMSQIPGWAVEDHCSDTRNDPWSLLQYREWCVPVGRSEIDARS